MLQVLFSALMLGGIYGVVAAGFSLVYGVMNILNVAHGALVMLGAYSAFSLATYMGADPLIAAPVSFIVLSLFGFLLYRYFLVKLSGYSIFMIFIFTFGLDMVLMNGASLIWRPISRNVPSPYRGQAIEIGGAYLPINSIIVLVGGWVLAVGIVLLLSRTKLGLAIQATSLDAESARLAGVNVDSVFAITFALTTGLAGGAGALLALLYSVNPFMGLRLIGIAFATAVLGGLGSVRGALLAGFVLALGEVSTATFLSVSYAQLVPYVILLIVLVVSPSGLLGRQYFAEVKI